LNNVKVARREILRPRSDPLGPDGGIAVLRGNLAPGGAVVKVFSVPEEMYFASAIIAADPALNTTTVLITDGPFSACSGCQRPCPDYRLH
jgi:dihydroxyacid dehydratase/phosphogluconate dehydratase